MARAGVAALLALLVVLAGCSALPGQDGPPGTTLSPRQDATQTDGGPGTATPRYGETPTPTPGRILPGLSYGGVTDTDALVDAHRATLAGTSYTLNATRTVRSPYGQVASEHVDAAFAAEPGRFRWTYQERDPDARPDLRFRAWGNGSALHRDFDRGGRDQYDDVTPGSGADLASSGLLLGEATQDETIYRHLSAFEITTVEPRRTMDGMRYRIRSRTVAAPAALNADGATVTNASLVGLVDADGVVRRLTVEYDLERAEGVESRRYDLRVLRVGTTTVERPDWVNTSAEPRAGDSQP